MRDDDRLDAPYENEGNLDDALTGITVCLIEWGIYICRAVKEAFK